jgi:hypothetical protein
VVAVAGRLLREKIETIRPSMLEEERAVKNFREL